MAIPLLQPEPLVSEEEAAARLRPRPGILAGLRRLGAKPAQGDRTERGAPARLELVRLPCALVERLDAPAEGKNGRAGLLVRGFAETVEIFRMDAPLQAAAAPDPDFRFPLSRERVLELARERWFALSTGRALRRAPTMPALEIVSWVAYPHWVCYFRTSGGRCDFRMLDALTGRRSSASIRAALLEFLAWKRRSAGGGKTGKV